MKPSIRDNMAYTVYILDGQCSFNQLLLSFWWLLDNIWKFIGATDVSASKFFTKKLKKPIMISKTLTLLIFMVTNSWTSIAINTMHFMKKVLKMEKI